MHDCTKYSKSIEYSETKKIGHSTLEYSPDPFFFSSIYSFWHSSTRTSGKKWEIKTVLGRVLETFFHSFEYSSARTSKLKRKKRGRASTRVSSGLFFSFPSTRYSSSTLYNHVCAQRKEPKQNSVYFVCLFLLKSYDCLRVLYCRRTKKKTSGRVLYMGARV